MSDSDSNSFVWFLAGLGVGALVGVLYAPYSGQETREVLRSKADEGRDYMRDPPVVRASRLPIGLTVAEMW